MRLRSLLASLSLAVTACGGGAQSSSDGGMGGTANGTGASGPSTGSHHGSGGTSASGGGGSTGNSNGGGGGADPCSGPRPGPTNTGVPAGVKLTQSGSVTVVKDGATVEALDIAGTITVLADNVTIKNVRITTGDYYPIRYFDDDNVGLVVEDSEIVGTNGDVTSAIAFNHYTALRLNIHGSSDGLKADAHTLIQDCWIHDLSNGPGEHNDGVQSTGGEGVQIIHNDISGASNSNVQTGSEGMAATTDLLVQCNWLDGGGYTLNVRGDPQYLPMGTKVIDNRFNRKDTGYGPWTFDDPHPIVTGNVWDDSGEAIPYP